MSEFDWSRQLVLDIQCWHPQRFDTYMAAQNELAVAALQLISNYPLIYLWGHSGSGKTHLLHAVYEAHDNAVYLDCEAANGKEMLFKFSAYDEAVSCLCIDNIQSIVADEAQEHQVFLWVNRQLEANQSIVIASQKAPKKLGIKLKDLESRLCWGPEFYLQCLDELSTRDLLKKSAERRGVIFPDDSLGYLLSRAKRDLKSLMLALDKLDEASLIAQRRLSIPFLKKILGL